MSLSILQRGTIMNPSRRKSKAVFVIRIGNGFIVNSHSVRLDHLEPPIMGDQDPESWIIGEAYQDIKDSPCYKDWKVTITVDIEPWKGLPAHKLREQRELLWHRLVSWHKRAGMRMSL